MTHMIDDWSHRPDENQPKRSCILAVNELLGVPQEYIHIWIDALQRALVFRLAPFQANDELRSHSAQVIISYRRSGWKRERMNTWPARTAEGLPVETAMQMSVIQSNWEKDRLDWRSSFSACYVKLPPRVAKTSSRVWCCCYYWMQNRMEKRKRK